MVAMSVDVGNLVLRTALYRKYCVIPMQKTHGGTRKSSEVDKGWGGKQTEMEDK